jgi:hypothetical protein
MRGTQTRYGKIWYCSAVPGGGPGHDRGLGSKPRSRCQCGAPIHNQRGQWAVFKQDAAGRPDGPPISEPRRMRVHATADAAKLAGTDTVLGWIPAPEEQA